jgi:hypothetical protein
LSASQHRHGLVVPHAERGVADPGEQRGRVAAMATNAGFPRLEIFFKTQRLRA